MAVSARVEAQPFGADRFGTTMPEVPSNGHARLEDKPLKELFSALSHDSATLFRQETTLFKREMEERLHGVEKKVAVMGAGAVVTHVGLLTLTAAVVLGLAEIMPAWVAAGIVAVFYLVGGMVALNRGKNELKNESLKPERSIASMKQDVRMVREAAR